MAERLRILFAGGGTGGHLYPGLTVAQALKDRQGEAEIAFFVTRRDIDRHVLENEPYMAQFEDARGFSTCPCRGCRASGGASSRMPSRWPRLRPTS